MQLLFRVASALTATTLAIAGTAGSVEASVRPVPEPNYSVNPANHANEYENRVVARINRARAHAGLKRIRVFQSCLDGHAERWSRHLAQSGRLVHRDQQQVLADCNLHWTGETLARGAGNLSPRVLVRAWMNSPEHKAVLMKPRAKLAGVAIRRDAQGRVVGVVNLGDPT
jgi:uncharacterized protein YkwD